MDSQHIQLLRCPVCNGPFAADERTLFCVNRHTFDLAREGYVNLLRKKQPGDSREMVLARHNFFARDHYRPLSDRLNELVYHQLPLYNSGTVTVPLSILDAGCGEGYYLARLQSALAEQGHNATCLGIDISKEALRIAAKHYKQPFFVVANLKERLVITDQSIHVLLNIFAPRNPNEFARVLVPGGLLLVVIPGPHHLHELRTSLHLLQIEENKQQTVITQFQQHFDIVAEEHRQFQLHLDKREIAELVTMTPNYWHLTNETRKAMEQMPEAQVTADFLCLVFRRREVGQAS